LQLPGNNPGIFPGRKYPYISLGKEILIYIYMTGKSPENTDISQINQCKIKNV